ncbi:MAG: hypothetical protein IKN46_04905 [Acholeplasmatales bacterium]|nr:hypothetical protein [Acholeplasmatales bacterium]
MIDQKLQQLEIKETNRLNDGIELIASENYPSQDILDLMGSHLSVKYAEGYDSSVSKQGRHYAGCEVINEVEVYAIEKAKELFHVNYANVQPHSGSQANQAVYAGLLKQGDIILSMSIESGGHLTHGAKASATSQYYNFVHYGLDENGDLNYEEIKQKLEKHHPRLLVVGASAYSKRINYERIREIVDEYNEKVWKYHVDRKFSDDFVMKDEYTFYAADNYVSADTPFCPGFNVKKGMTKQDIYDTHKCMIMSDSAHVMGFIAAHMWKDKYDPTKWCDVVTSTTHKTLRGPRGGIILWNDEKLCSKLNSGLFPRIQGGPNEACVAAKCQCFIEALKPSFKDYMELVYHNMQALIDGIKDYDKENKINFVSGGSENHMVLIDLKNAPVNGKEAEDLLNSYHIICNKNMMPGNSKPSESSAIRIGTPAITTRGFDEQMSFELGRLIARILLRGKQVEQNGVVDFEDESIRSTVKKMLDKVGPFYKVKEVEKLIQDNNPNTPDDLA